MQKGGPHGILEEVRLVEATAVESMVEPAAADTKEQQQQCQHSQ